MTRSTYDERDAFARVRRSPVTEHAESSRSYLRNLARDLDNRQQTGSTPAKLSAADFYVPDLPGLPDLAAHPTHPVNLFAGLIPSYPGDGQGGGEGRTGKDAKIFFMMARARRSAGKQRVIFWFNGGPGCSSFDGSLMEVGPFRTVPAAQSASGTTEIKLVEGGWEEFATIVFIDQPPGTGLSTVPVDGYLKELTQASQHLIHFMKNFYKVFPELQLQDTYLAGESYAGQYIPYFADALLKTTQLPKLRLRGVAIGNGWIDPLRQYPAYAEFAYTKGLIKKGTDAATRLDAEVEKCNAAMEKYTDPTSTPININECESIMHKVTEPFRQEINGVKKCMNIYDVRLMDDDPQCGLNWPPDLSDVYSFLARSDVVSALHATEHSGNWQECNGRVGSYLSNHDSPAAVHLIPGIVEKGVKVMMFAGAEDLICNYVGIERMLDAMTWNGAQGFGNATVQKWSLNDTKVGEWTESRNMTYVKVLEASHMVGFDVPDVTNDMIMRFMDVDMNEVSGWTGLASSSVGDDERPAVHFGPMPETDKGIPLLKGGHSDWEAWYNAVSAVLILCTLGGIVGLYLWFRSRKAKAAAFGRVQLPLAGERDRARDAEERVPLAAAEDYELDTRSTGLDKGKGKQRMHHSDDEMSDAERGETVFALGDEDDHEGRH